MKYKTYYGFRFKDIDSQKIQKLVVSNPELEKEARELTALLDEFWSKDQHNELIGLSAALEKPLIIEVILKPVAKETLPEKEDK